MLQVSSDFGASLGEFSAWLTPYRINFQFLMKFKTITLLGEMLSILKLNKLQKP